MKKNKLFLLGLFVVFAAVLSLSLVSNTLAKYTSNGSSSDSARVAKWGVTVTATSADQLFLDAYGTTVQASVALDDVLAPGTNGEFAGFTVAGTPEVDVRVSYVATVVLSGWAVTGDDFYCPVVVTITYDGGAATKIDGLTFDTAAQFKEAIENAINGKTKDYDANTNLNAVDDDLQITWEWAFETGADAAEKAANTVKDTLLGDAAAASSASTISLDVKATIEQID